MFVLWTSDLDSPSYFVATAAVQLGFFQREGVEVRLIFGEGGPGKLKSGEAHFAACSTYSPTGAFPSWHGLKVLCALAQNSYWFLAVRKDLDVTRGDLQALKGLRISASAGFPMTGLKHVIEESGLDLVRDHITLLPAVKDHDGPDFRGRRGADVILSGAADAFWGNGMRVAVAEHLGVAKVHLDIRRGDGPPGARHFNFPMLAATDALISSHPEVAAAAVRAIVKTQQALRLNPNLATDVGNALFPSEEAALIAPLIARDSAFYDAAITHEAVQGVMQLGVRQKMLARPVPYDDWVATQFSQYWKP